MVAAISSLRLSPLTAGMLSWDLWSLAFIGLTLAAYGRADHDHLRRLVAGTPMTGWQKVLAGGQDGPGFSVQFAVIALAAAALLPRLERFAPTQGESELLTILIVLAVALSWVVVTLSYTVHYARLDAAEHSLEFPGHDQPQFVDYLYFAAAIATTFGTTDVTVATTRMRRAVTGHAVLTFVFNTVIIALLVTALTA